LSLRAKIEASLLRWPIMSDVSFSQKSKARISSALNVNRRWAELGIKPTERYIGRPEGIFKHWWEDEAIIAARDLKVMP